MSIHSLTLYRRLFPPNSHTITNNPRFLSDCLFCVWLFGVSFSSSLRSNNHSDIINPAATFHLRFPGLIMSLWLLVSVSGLCLCYPGALSLYFGRCSFALLPKYKGPQDNKRRVHKLMSQFPANHQTPLRYFVFYGWRVAH